MSGYPRQAGATSPAPVLVLCAALVVGVLAAGLARVAPPPPGPTALLVWSRFDGGRLTAADEATVGTTIGRLAAARVAGVSGLTGAARVSPAGTVAVSLVDFAGRRTDRDTLRSLGDLRARTADLLLGTPGYTGDVAFAYDRRGVLAPLSLGIVASLFGLPCPGAPAPRGSESVRALRQLEASFPARSDLPERVLDALRGRR